MLAKQGSVDDLDKKGFIFEPKFDGTRVLIHKKGNEIKLMNRRDKNITYRYPELKNIGKNIEKDCVLDGELLILNEKHLPDFNLLQKREQLDNKLKIKFLSENSPVTIFVFDILKLEGKDLTPKTLKQRKKALESQLNESEKISLISYTKRGRELWKKIKNLKLEGVMAKKLHSKYEKGKRSGNWLKIKNTKTLDAIVIGYTQEKREISSLVLAAYHKNKLRYIGRVSAGLSEKEINMLLKKFESTEKPPIKPETAEASKKINYVKPEVIVEVKYLEITKDLMLRAPVFLRIRKDKQNKDCVI